MEQHEKLIREIIKKVDDDRLRHRKSLGCKVKPETVEFLTRSMRYHIQEIEDKECGFTTYFLIATTECYITGKIIAKAPWKYTLENIQKRLVTEPDYRISFFMPLLQKLMYPDCGGYFDEDYKRDNPKDKSE